MDNLSRYIMPGTPQRIIDRYATLPSIAAKADYGEYHRRLV